MFTKSKTGHPPNGPSYARKRLKSFLYAFDGIRALWSEPHIRIHLLATVFALGAGFIQNLSSVRWAILLICIASVWITEAINTAIEKLCNLVHPTYHPIIKIVKDMTAAAVLFAAILSILIFFIIIL